MRRLLRFARNDRVDYPAVFIFSLLLFSSLVAAAGLDPVGVQVCEDKGEGTHTLRYPQTNGIRLRVVCRDTEKTTVVRYGWYFDTYGRKTRDEDWVDGNPEKSRIVEFSYDLQSTQPTGTHTYNGKGKLIASTSAQQEAAAAKKKGAAGVRALYTQYVEGCEASPQALLYPLIGQEKDPQFFTKVACACVAEKAVRADDAPPGKVWTRMKTLRYDNPRDRLTVTALQNMSACLCPNAFPESRLADLCTHAADVERAWTPE